MGPFAASWPLRGAPSPRRVPPAAPRQFGTQRGQSDSFGRTRIVRSQRGVDAARHARLRENRKFDLS